MMHDFSIVQGFFRLLVTLTWRFLAKKRFAVMASSIYRPSCAICEMPSWAFHRSDSSTSHKLACVILSQYLKKRVQRSNKIDHKIKEKLWQNMSVNMESNAAVLRWACILKIFCAAEALATVIHLLGLHARCWKIWNNLKCYEIIIAITCYNNYNYRLWL